MSNKLSDYLTTAQAAEALGLSEGRVRQFVMRGQIARTKLGHLNLISRKDLEAFRKTDRPPGNPAFQVTKKTKSRKKA
jgi:excisionase family DNA binding protein